MQVVRRSWMMGVILSALLLGISCGFSSTSAANQSEWILSEICPDSGTHIVYISTPGQASYSDGQKESLNDLVDGIGLSSEVTGSKKKTAGSKTTEEKH